jgi:Skp family chaperone for outer membrane proteins
MISYEAFYDELEKIAMTADDISRRLGAFAEKVTSMSKADKNATYAKTDRNSSRMMKLYSSLKDPAKQRAYSQGRSSIIHATGGPA